jgi:ribokinase
VTFDVVVLGSANVDVVVRVALIPAPGETVLGTGRERHPGGKGLNQAVAAARAGARTAFVGTVGRDPEGDRLLATMRDEGIDTTAVDRVDEPTGMALVVVQQSGENAIVVSPGANDSATALSPAGTSLLGPGAVLVVQLEIPDALVAEGATLARAAGATVVLNAAPARPLSDTLLANVDVLVVNEHEAVALTGTADLPTAAAGLARRVPAVVVTLGADGAMHLARDGGGPVSTPGLAADVVDTTGAGDAFVGVLAAALATGANLPAAVRRAVAAGSLAVERRGAVPSMPAHGEIDERLRTGSC